MKIIFNNSKTLEIRKKVRDTAPFIQLCHFCHKPITKMNGLGPDSLLIHSLDGNNRNWDPSNKVPTHRGCHQRFHTTGDRNPSKRSEVAAKISKTRTGSKTGRKAWRTRRERYGPTGMKHGGVVKNKELRVNKN